LSSPPGSPRLTSRGFSSLSSAPDLFSNRGSSLSRSPSILWPSASLQLRRWVVCLQTSTLLEISSLSPSKRETWALCA
jgi:hypothetical protein